MILIWLLTFSISKVVIASDILFSSPESYKLPSTDEERNFVLEENNLTEYYLERNSEFSKKLASRSVELLPKNAGSVMSFSGWNIIFGKDGALIRLIETNKEEVLIPAAVLPNGARIQAFKISPDQTKIAFGFSFFGSDWQTWQFYDLDKGKIIDSEGPYKLKPFGTRNISWLLDSSGYIYHSDSSITEDANGITRPQIYIRKLGTPKSHDRVIFENIEKTVTTNWKAEVVNDKFAVVLRSQGAATIPVMAFLVNMQTGSKEHIVEPNKFLGNTPVNVLVGTSHSKIYLRSSRAGNNFGIIEIDANSPKPFTSSKVLIPENKSANLFQAILSGNRIVTHYINKKLSSEIHIYDLAGKLINSFFPGSNGMSPLASPAIPFTNADSTSSKLSIVFSATEMAPRTVNYDIEENRFEVLPDLADVNFDSRKISVEKISYQGLDGHPVEMLIYKRSDIAVHKFIYLFSYGFIGIPNLPQWNRKFQLALDLGAVVALPMIRGGGEFGADHQLSGTNDRWSTFNDLVAASRWLKKNISTETNKVMVVGRSFGGLSAAVHYVFNQNDFDIFSSIVPVTSWVDHFKGSGWWMGDDFGINRNSRTGLSNSKDVARLLHRVSAWDPVANLSNLNGRANGTLKPIILFSAEYDTNTTPVQASIFVKKIKQRLGNNIPVYMFEHSKGGHSARAELVDELLFGAKQLGITDFNPIRK